MKKRVYISGPITNIENQNIGAFLDAQRRFESAGWAVINPHTFAGAVEKEWADYMKVDLMVMLLAVDAIAILPNWWGSVGSRVEIAVAKAFNLPIYNAKTMQPIMIDVQLSFNGGSTLTL